MRLSAGCDVYDLTHKEYDHIDTSSLGESVRYGDIVRCTDGYDGFAQCLDTGTWTMFGCSLGMWFIMWLLCLQLSALVLLDT